MTEDTGVPSLVDERRRDVMKAPTGVSAMMRLKALGWGSKRIAAELGRSRNTVRHWLARGDWQPCSSPSRSKKLDGLSDWLRSGFVGTPAMRMWFARNWCERRTSPSADPQLVPWSAQCTGAAGTRRSHRPDGTHGVAR